MPYRPHLLLAAALVALTLPQTAIAQTMTAAPPSGPEAQAAQTDLAAALMQAAPPAKGIGLTVGSEFVRLPKDAMLATKGATLAEIGAAYGRAVRRFGLVTAVAPLTMTVLNTAPGTPNPYDGMPPEEAAKLLAASLTDSQWQALSGDGLGLSDLSSAEQRSLFMALFPLKDGKLMANPRYDADHPYKADVNENRDLTGEVSQAKIRLTREYTVMLPITGTGSSGPSYMGMTPETPGGPRKWFLQNFFGNKDALYGQKVRDEVPNIPKRGQLDYRNPALQVAVPLTGVKTVGDLIHAVSLATQLEIYADKRYEAKKVAFVGSAPVSASDLLQALAFCVTGTYRQVGPAFVLTDDILGIGTRSQIWYEFEQTADAMRRGVLEEAGDKILPAHMPNHLLSLDDSLKLTPEQLAVKSDMNSGLWAELNPRAQLPLNQLTPAQQDYAKREFAMMQKEHFGNSFGNKQTASLDGKIWISSQAQMQVLFPSIGVPMEMNNIGGQLFQPTQKMYSAYYEAEQKKQASDKAKPKNPPLPSLTELMNAVPRRAVLAAPRTVAGVDATVAAMKKLGFNQLWLDVFSGGAAHLPGLPFTDATGQTDILAEALKQTKGTNISVFPVLSLFQWGPKPPPEAVDLTVLGETSAQAALREEQRSQIASVQPASAPPQKAPTLDPMTTVSPFSPAARETLATLVRALATRRGIAGIVWRDAAPLGYVYLPNGYDGGTRSLGYTLPARLAFLRTRHADPVDIPPPYRGKANTELPNFDEGELEQTLRKQWRTFCADGDLFALRRLYAAATVGSAPPRLLVHELRGQNDTWYGSWENPKAAPPRFHQPWEDTEPGQAQPPQQDAPTQAKAQSRVAFAVVSVWGATMKPQDLANQLTNVVDKKPWDGFVLDTMSGGGDLAKRAENPLGFLTAPK